MIELSGLSTVACLIGAPASSKSPVSAGNKLKIIVVGAHPGDPECGCRALRAGNKIHVEHTIINYYLSLF